ncbi:MAG: hypothetical protein DKM50_07310 [Candidatus Margulisiibacteriota bacterium]|nr:MAG: hypothetical protein A2X43_12750 [Candidatus Margulisbacteria bacterium GWD2_39_127]OGI02148.1 MAG: hypothetical protein A2X42_01365 [Candidatus Margulisbacteria bacterium GWF2_38_17]OGI10524.1 MAG: hypothetical protein A2X41_06865 [Candidatus Margulisbacteria bacterium GWE2_39_32]PZM80030.1 MAG: hypothetical protein DKM50_07310 [Candidatus Margulisiibacteriota bacterium]HAR62444.1 hypothetical protein [Candidatus Margulisiibacteriota bacterium]
MVKKISLMLTIAALSILCIAGCGQKSNQEATETPQENQQEAVAPATAAPATEEVATPAEQAAPAAEAPAAEAPAAEAPAAK